MVVRVMGKVGGGASVLFIYTITTITNFLIFERWTQFRISNGKLLICSVSHYLYVVIKSAKSHYLPTSLP